MFLSKTMISSRRVVLSYPFCLPKSFLKVLTFSMLSPLPVLEKNSAGFLNKIKTVNLSESKTNQLDICDILHFLVMLI